jgi:hypothetical protein
VEGMAFLRDRRSYFCMHQESCKSHRWDDGLVTTSTQHSTSVPASLTQPYTVYSLHVCIRYNPNHNICLHPTSIPGSPENTWSMRNADRFRSLLVLSQGITLEEANPHNIHTIGNLCAHYSVIWKVSVSRWT